MKKPHKTCFGDQDRSNNNTQHILLTGLVSSGSINKTISVFSNVYSLKCNKITQQTRHLYFIVGHS